MANDGSHCDLDNQAKRKLIEANFFAASPLLRIPLPVSLGLVMIFWPMNIINMAHRVTGDFHVRPCDGIGSCKRTPLNARSQAGG
jgi:hypothetical protein